MSNIFIFFRSDGSTSKEKCSTFLEKRPRKDPFCPIFRTVRSTSVSAGSAECPTFPPDSPTSAKNRPTSQETVQHFQRLVQHFKIYVQHGKKFVRHRRKNNHHREKNVHHRVKNVHHCSRCPKIIAGWRTSAGRTRCRPRLFAALTARVLFFGTWEWQGMRKIFAGQNPFRDAPVRAFTGAGAAEGMEGKIA